MLLDQLNNIVKSAKLPIIKRVENKDLWEETFLRLPYKPVAYSNASLDYQLVYQQGHGGSWFDLSVIIFWNNKPAALWPLSLSMNDGVAKLTSQGLPVLPPVFVSNCPLISRKRIIKSCLELANSIVIDSQISEWRSGESFTNSIGMSEWHMQSMAHGAVCNLNHECYIDIQLDISEIKKNFRKSYKSLIVSGPNLWSVGVFDSDGNYQVWQEFRALHCKVAGRVTRSVETWNLHHQEIKSKRAFLVWLRNSKGEMVGGGFFNVTTDEGLYAVAAYDRTLFDKPLGHLVQYRAITELKKLGVRWYKIGARPYIQDSTKPTDKEISIGKFKQGFATHIFPYYCLTHKAV